MKIIPLVIRYTGNFTISGFYHCVSFYHDYTPEKGLIGEMIDGCQAKDKRRFERNK
jgi:hypothetical protein